MFHGRPPPRGPFDGRGPPPSRPYPLAGHGDDRNRIRPPYHSGYHDHDHGHTDYRRSPPYRNYAPKPSGGYRGGGHWSCAPHRERSHSPRQTLPVNHNLVITVGNELTGSSPSQRHDRDLHRKYERSHSRDRSPDRSRAKSRGRSKSRARSKSRHHSRSLDRGRAQSRGRSKSRPRSRSRSREESRGRSSSKAPSRARSKSRKRRSQSSSSSCSSAEHKLRGGGRRMELEDMWSLPTKSILKKRTDYEDSPSVKSTDLPRGVETSSMSHVAEQLLQAVRGMEPTAVASMLSELQSDPQMAQRANINEILNLLDPLVTERAKSPDETAVDIDDEEKFLYGESAEPKTPAPPQLPQNLMFDLYGDVTEEVLYGDLLPPTTAAASVYDIPTVALPHLQAPRTTSEINTTCLPSSLKPNNVGKVLTQAPQLEHVRDQQARDEYQNIQSLLKTIGFDLGMTEITKMAARTKERLEGNKPSRKTAMQRRRHSSSSSENSCRKRRHSSSSSSSSTSDVSGGLVTNWTTEGGRSNTTAPSTPYQDAKAECSTAISKELEQQASDSTAPPPSRVPIPSYPPPQVHNMMPPGYLPPGYAQYGNFVPYTHPQWPPMYPPPGMTLPPPPNNNFNPALPYSQAFDQQPPESKVKGAPMVASQVSEQENNESQKQKVLEERENLKQERDLRMKKKEYLMKELEKLRKQQGELLRRKRREKDGHKDPLLQEIGRLQEDVIKQISNLRKEHEAAEKKRSEIDKVALILGLTPSDRPRKLSDTREDDVPQPRSKKQEAEHSPGQEQDGGMSQKQTILAPNQPSVISPSPPPDPFEYYDAGNHWCKNCNVTSGSMFDFFTHLHSKMHWKTLDPYERPWASSPSEVMRKTPIEEKQTKPAKGSEFLLPVRGFFCLLCKKFFGDAICAEEHTTTHFHNDCYKKKMYENPLYEQRRNLDRQAGLVSDVTGKKRKNEEDKMGKIKAKKEKKDEEEVQCDDMLKVEKEEEKPKALKKEDELKTSKSRDERSPSHGKKNEDEKYESKKKEKYYSSTEEEERPKYSRRVEEEHCKQSHEGRRYRHHRQEEDHYDKWPRYDTRDENRHKSAKYLESRSKHEHERDDREAEKDTLKKSEGTPEFNKPPRPPYGPPKILSGPSPAMRAKLRKQSLEAAKSMVTSFGKFTWRKKESQLVVDAQKVAAQFIKEDEEAAKCRPTEDPFLKSVAVAKEIAQKLRDKSDTPQPWASAGANQSQIRPNLPAPASVLGPTFTTPKPAPFIRPQRSGGPLAPTNSSFPASNIRYGPHAFVPRPVPPVSQCVPRFASPGPSVPRPSPAVAQPAPLVPKAASLVSSPALSVSKAAPPESPLLPTAAPPLSGPEPLVVNPAPQVWKPNTADVGPSETPTTANMEPDVAAPGVPESEQTRAVFVKPPPLFNKADGAQRSEKPKSNLAAAKAQDLFGILYSSMNKPGPLSLAKSTTVNKGDSSSTQSSSSTCPTGRTPQPSNTPEQTENGMPQNPKHQSQSDIHIESVWSLQTGPDLAPEGVLSQHDHEPAKIEPTSQSQHEVQPVSESKLHDDTPIQDFPEPLQETPLVTEPKYTPCRRTRGKTAQRKTPPRLSHVRQTRSQTRSPTRQQHFQGQSDSDPASGDSDLIISELSDHCSKSHKDGESPSKENPQVMETTAENVDMTLPDSQLTLSEKGSE
ncbi:zinc finger protein 318 [Dunckerocampus dactyliophorus]|uniref:zinc finger protein 318 n=1 Tax=Dunckerocampus dactyliophorus TaxID=161453 RepID=UPI0024075DAB|nr:zinc finger protein 318 [Dunckerocampus dactyliophorus]